MTLLEVYRKVQEIKDKYGTNDPFKLCEDEDIILHKQPLPDEVLGFFHTYDGDSIICLNNNLSHYEERYTLAHEFAHHHLHSCADFVYLRHNTFQSESKFEYHAEVYASELLLNDNIFDIHKGLTTAEMASLEKVPEKFILLKYNKLYKI